MSKTYQEWLLELEGGKAPVLVNTRLSHYCSAFIVPVAILCYNAFLTRWTKFLILSFCLVFGLSLSWLLSERVFSFGKTYFPMATAIIYTFIYTDDYVDYKMDWENHPKIVLMWAAAYFLLLSPIFGFRVLVDLGW